MLTKLVILAVVVILAGVMLLPVGGGLVREPASGPQLATMDLSAFADEKPGKSLRLLFIHHSCGGQLMAEVGPETGENCINETHPNGGGLRKLLTGQGYEVHQASYGSQIGENTDIHHWLPKFRDQMDKVLTCDRQDVLYTDGRKNQVVAFKSCYPNNNFRSQGEAPGTAGAPELIVVNAQATYRALLSEFAKYPQVLFVCVTAPPLLGKSYPTRLGKKLMRQILGRENPDQRVRKSGELARIFNNWLKSRDGWLKDYKGKNVVVFDHYHYLTGEGKSNFLEYATGGGSDSHPASEGNGISARAFVPFLNRAVRRAGI